jgi:hypothetical protein
MWADTGAPSLLRLQWSSGALFPTFDPEVFAYNLWVDSGTAWLSFSLQTASNSVKFQYRSTPTLEWIPISADYATIGEIRVPLAPGSFIPAGNVSFSTATFPIPLSAGSTRVDVLLGSFLTAQPRSGTKPCTALWCGGAHVS